MQDKQKAAILRPSDGIRGLMRTGTGVMLTLTILLCAALTLHRQSIHADAGVVPPLSWLRIMGLLLMAFGALCSLVLSLLPRSSVTPAVGMFALVTGVLALSVSTAAEVVRGYGALWTVQTVLEAAALLSAAAVFFCALLVCCERRAFGTNIAGVVSGICTCSLVMLLMRITVSFSGVFSVGGSGFDYSQADKYSGQLMWIFATAQPQSDTAREVMAAALLERLALALMMLFLAMFFSMYARQMTVLEKRLIALDDIPVTPARQTESEQIRPEVQTRPEPQPRREAQPRPEPQVRPEPQAESRPRFRSRQNEPQPRPEPQAESRSRFRSRQNEPQPRPEPQAHTEPQPRPEQRPAVRVRVARPAQTQPRPAPQPVQQPIQPQPPAFPFGGDDDSIWNRYAD